MNQNMKSSKHEKPGNIKDSARKMFEKYKDIHINNSAVMKQHCYWPLFMIKVQQFFFK